MYTNDWFGSNIGIWERVLTPLANKPLQALEIGTFEGRAAVWLLEHILTHKESHITCVDTFAPTDNLAQLDINWNEVQQNFKENTKPYKNKVTLAVKDSRTFLKEDTTMYDIIYIDGSHMAEAVLVDSVLAHLRLNKKGYIIFDDYMYGHLQKGVNVPKPAVDAFMECFANEYNWVSIGYQVILQKK